MPADRGTARLTALVHVASARARAARRAVLVSLVEPAPMHDPLEALDALAHAAASDPSLAVHADGGRMYWSPPGEGFALAGFGAVATFTAAGPGRFAEIDRAWAELRADALVDVPSDGGAGLGPVLMGGFAFEPDGSSDGRWDGFPAALLTLPRLQLAVMDGECWVTTTLRVDADGRPDVEPDALIRLRGRVLEAPAPARRSPSATAAARHVALAFDDERPAADWRALVGAAVSAIRAGEMDKVVLARAVRVTAPGEIDATAALRHLRAAHPECFVFGCWRGGRAFVGASPERLVRLDGRKVRTSSLAGSMRRGATPAEDAVLAAELLASAKDRAEQEVVSRALGAALAELCDEVIAPEGASVLTLRNVHHLHTPVEARLRAGGTLLDLVGRLHPSPAVGGLTIWRRSRPWDRNRACTGTGNTLRFRP